MADNTSQQLLDMWKRQVEEGTQAWLRMMGQAQVPTAMPNMAPNMAMSTRRQSGRQPINDSGSPTSRSC